VLQAFDPLPRIAEWWQLQGRPLAPEDWDADAGLFMRAGAGLRTVSWVQPNGKRSWTAQPGLNVKPNTFEKPSPELQNAVEVARRLDAVAIPEIFESDGKPMLYACAPVKRNGKLVGFVAGLYDASELIRSVLEKQLPEDYAVTVTAGGHRIAAVASPKHKPSLEGAREIPLSVAHSNWTVGIVPSAGDATTMRRLVTGFGLLISILVYACASMASTARRRAAELATVNQRLGLENLERRRAEERVGELNRDLQRRLQEFQVLMEVLPIGIGVAADPECRNIWINPSMAAMLQVPLEQNISKSGDDAGKLTFKLQHNGVDVPPDQLPMQVAARTHSPVANQELEIVRKDGSVIHTLSYSAPLFDERCEVRGVINACVDITERRRAEEENRLFLIRGRELEQRVERGEKYRSLALMAGGIAHDFNNLLTVIIGQANLLALEVPKTGGTANKINELVSAANRAAELTSRLLSFTGRIWWNARPVNLGTEVEEMKPVIRGMVPPTIELRYGLAPTLPLVHAGIPELHQVILHLVENAVEALGRSGTIEIRTSECDLDGDQIDKLHPDEQLTPGHFVRLEVVDNGCGIPSEIAARIFDPFFTTKFVGRGLGLSAVLGIMRAHRGAIRVESAVGRGTCAEIILPVKPAKAAPNPVEEPALTLVP
jgi:signal transduction histidine kinase